MSLQVSTTQISREQQRTRNIVIGEDLKQTTRTVQPHNQKDWTKLPEVLATQQNGRDTSDRPMKK